MALLQCPECGNPVSDRATTCPKCGTPLHPTAAPQPAPMQGFTQQVYNAAPQRPPLTPEQAEYLDKFHWGPFTFSCIWALCNNLVIHGLVAIVTILFTGGIATCIAAFLFAFKGNRWAWEKSTARTFEEYVQQQEPWDKWGKILFLGLLAISGVIIIGSVIILIVAAASN